VIGFFDDVAICWNYQLWTSLFCAMHSCSDWNVCWILPFLYPLEKRLTAFHLLICISICYLLCIQKLYSCINKTIFFIIQNCYGLKMLCYIFFLSKCFKTYIHIFLCWILCFSCYWFVYWIEMFCFLKEHEHKWNNDDYFVLVYSEWFFDLRISESFVCGIGDYLSKMKS